MCLDQKKCRAVIFRAHHKKDEQTFDVWCKVEWKESCKDQHLGDDITGQHRKKWFVECAVASNGDMKDGEVTTLQLRDWERRTDEPHTVQKQVYRQSWGIAPLQKMFLDSLIDGNVRYA